MSTVFRVEKSGNFTIMSNVHLKDSCLSLRAAGLLSKILSLPPEWDFTLSGLAKITSDGVDSVRATIHELEKFGYITRRQLRDERGRMSQNEYHVYEDPKQNPDYSCENSEDNSQKYSEFEQTDKNFLCEPLSESPSAENPSTVNPTTDTYYILNTHSSITQSRAARGADGGTEREKYFSLICENIEFDDLAEKDKVTELVEVMVDVICFNRSTVRVNGGELPIEQVRKRFLELRRKHIENVLKTLESNSVEVRNLRAYLITLLYNAPVTVCDFKPKSKTTSGTFEMQTSSFDVDEVMKRIWARYEKRTEIE